MNTNEARLAIHRSISAMLLELAEAEQDEPLTDEERADFTESMDDAADMILDRLGLEVVTLDAGTPPLVTVVVTPR